ncbi:MULTISPECIES: riboflavin synthase subunit alpha [Deefgea]|uniref:Riboflavin synthase n=1 Tax=Deefgea chitinilytica TaxID=570276 RepID=A0ABS2C955_9NEIS|nr:MULTISPECIES: riboflavin synthase subunit alpha [Deefgea]MBM5570679.1 riboflavin synthase subunit alpha [Deefgea chitinilytica]MBM9887908.1 riboflavin synthase subunit alpha [Deefgea sp. CFH1-16]
MFTGIVQGVARIKSVLDREGIRTFEIAFPEGFCADIQIGASVAIDGVCLTVTQIEPDNRLFFDVMLQSLKITTLAQYAVEDCVNAERAAKDGAEIGGHPLSGHVDFTASVMQVRQDANNYCMRIAVPKEALRYVFAKGYIAVNGASLTVSEVNKSEGWFEVWLIPETRRMTVFEYKTVGDQLNIEIERATQVVVDTVRECLEDRLGTLLPALEALLAQQGVDINTLTLPTNKDM